MERPAQPPRSRPRASQACVICRARKIRCDISQRQPCTNCATGNKKCEPAVQVADNAIQVDRPRRSRYTVDNLRAPLPAPGFQRIAQAGLANDSQHRRPPADSGHPHDASIGALYSPKTRPVPTRSDSVIEHRSRTVDDDILLRNLEAASSAASAAAVSPLDSMSATPGVSKGPPPASSQTTTRIKFAEEIFTHALLPHMIGHVELVVNKQQASREVHRGDLYAPTGPKAVRPYGKSPWINADCQEHLDSLRHLPPEDRYYLVNMKKVFHFPQRAVGQALLATFFESVYPLLPIVDGWQTAELFESLYSGRPSSPLFFHALMFVACHGVDDARLQDAGFDTVASAQLYFFRRAQLLYTFDCESDHLLVLQSLILLSYWWKDYTEEKDMRYWMGCAVKLAFFMGMHKTVPSSFDMSPHRRALWRRIFWALYGRDHTIAPSMGSPFSLGLKDCDLDPLTEADFAWGPKSDTLPTKSYPYLSSQHSPGQVEVNIVHIKLACRLEQFLLVLQQATNYEDSVIAIEGMKDLAARETVYTPAMQVDGFSIDDPLTWDKTNVFVVFHLIYYERIVTLYFRRYEKALFGSRKQRSRAAAAPATSPVFDPPRDIDMAELESKIQSARAAIHDSAHRMSKMLHEVVGRGLLQLTPSFVSASALHTLLTLSEKMVLNPEGTSEYNNAKFDFQRVLSAVGELRRCWSAASWFFSMFSSLAQKDFLALKMSREQAMISRPQSRHASRYPSGASTPVLSNYTDGMHLDLNMDSWDFAIPLTDNMPFLIDGYGNWQYFGDLNDWHE